MQNLNSSHPHFQLGNTSALAAVQIDSLVKEFKPTRDFAQKNPEKINERGTVSAIDGLSLTAHRGEVCVLLGANGAGKTTTLACAQGLQKPTSGTVQLLGENPWGASPELRARVGIMLQDGGLPQAMRPIPLLKHISSMYQNPLKVDEIAERLGIHSFNGTTIRRLSGGQKQRVALAAALMGRPEVLFLDEPSAGLDPQSRNVVFEIIREQKEKGVGIILTTHLLDDAQRLADDVYIVDAGTVVRHGSVQELLAGEDSKHKRLTFTLADKLNTQRLTDRLGSDVTLIHLSDHHYALEGQLSPGVIAQLGAELEQQNLMPVSLELSQRTLEDVFLEISGRDIQ